jgi:hypothetical protein
LERIEVDSNQNYVGTFSNAFETPSYAPNQGLGPSPMIPEGPKTLGVVAMATESTGIERSNPELPKSDFAITFSVADTLMHAPYQHITHEEANLRLKNQPIPTKDAPATSPASFANSAGKMQIPANPDLISGDASYRNDQHEIPHLPVKNQNFPTTFENRRRIPATLRQARGGHAPEHPDQCVGNFVPDQVPSSDLPREVPTVTNQARKSYAAALSGKSVISQAERSQRKSFAHILQSPQDSNDHRFVAKEPFMHMGEPAVAFTEEEEDLLSEPYKFTLVGKFSRRKPSMIKVRDSFLKFGFCGDYMIGLIDATHILIHLAHEDDYSRLFLKPTWYIDGCHMRVFKWTPNFNPQHETPIVPIWVAFPLLPIHFRAKSSLFALAKAIGVPLRIDEATSDLRRPSEARVCIEVNLEYKLPDRIWIEREKRGGYWQTVLYDKKPDYCFRCKHFGHIEKHCSVGPHSAPPPAPVVDPTPRPTADVSKDKGKGKEVVIEPPKRWVPVQREQRRHHAASTSGVQIQSFVSSVVTSATLPAVASAHVQTQSVAPSVPHPIVTVLPVSSTVAQHVDPVLPPTSTSVATTLAPSHIARSPYTSYFNPLADYVIQAPFEAPSDSITPPDNFLPSTQTWTIQYPVSATSTPPVVSMHVISPPITPFYDPMLDEILQRPQIFDYPSNTVTRAAHILGPTPGRVQAHISTPPPPICHQNVEASIPSLHSAQSDTEGSSQIEVHQQGPFRRSSCDDLVGLSERTEDDGFIPVVRKRHPRATDIPFPSRRVTRSQSQSTSSHSTSL